MSELRTPADPADEPPGGGLLTHHGAARSERSEPPASGASHPHATRFRTAIAALCGLAVVAVAVAVAAATQGRGSAASTAPWAQWRPPDGGSQGARDIADYVAPLYRISPVDQLDVITVVNLESQTAAAAQQAAAANGTPTGSSGGLQVAVRPNASSSQVSLLSGNTVAYNLCGIGGKNCAIGAGTASTNRELLLRREALELAMYTFKYISGTENVVAILPPGHAEQTQSTLTKKLPTTNGTPSGKPVDIAVLFVRQELAPLLKEPLSLTLPEQEPPTVNQMANAPEAGLVDQVTARGLFSEQLQQTQDGSRLIVLDPLPAQ